MADGNGIVDGNGSATQKEKVTFVAGDLVVYPNHGAGTVSGVEEKTILGEERRYYIVYVPDGGLTLNIPADGDSGLRSCAGEAEVDGALEILRGILTAVQGRRRRAGDPHVSDAGSQAAP